MKEYYLLTGLLSAFALPSSPIAGAAQSPEVAQIEVAVSSEVAKLSPVHGRVVLDDRGGVRPWRDNRSIEVQRAREHVQALASALGAERVGRVDSVFQCDGPPSTCRLLEAETLVVIDAPDIDSDRASVMVHLWIRADSSRQPVGSRSYRFDLERVGAAWRVTDVELVRTT